MGARRGSAPLLENFETTVSTCVSPPYQCFLVTPLVIGIINLHMLSNQTFEDQNHSRLSDAKNYRFCLTAEPLRISSRTLI